MRSRILDEGSCVSLTSSGDRIVVGAGSSLLILDATDPNQLVRIGKVHTDAQIEKVVVRDHLAYLATNSAGMTIVDFSVESEPIVIAQVPTASRVFGLTVEGNFAYVAEKGYGLSIYDVSNPEAPVWVSGVQMFEEDLPEQGAWTVKVSGERAYLVDLHGLSIINIENPEQPFLVYRRVGSAYDVEIQDNIAFLVTEASNSLIAFDISDPDTLIALGTVGVLGPALHVTVQNDTAYVGGEQNGLTVVDVRDPHNMSQIARFDPPGEELDIHGTCVLGHTCYFATINQGVYSFPISGLPSVNAVRCYAAGHVTQRLDAERGRVFVADYYLGFTEVDISDPEPREWNHTWHPGPQYTYGNGVALYRQGETLYAITADNDGGMRILDVTDRDNHSLIYQQSFSHAYDVLIKDDFAYVGAAGQTRIYDLSTLPPQGVTAIVYGNGEHRNLAATENYLLIARGPSGLSIFDVSDPHSPAFVASMSPGGEVQDVAARGDYAYLALRENGLAVYDISQVPPIEVAHLTLEGLAGSVTLEDELLFVGAENTGIHVFSVARPDSIFEVAYSDDYNFFGYVEIADLSTEQFTEKIACVSSYFAGLSLFDVTGLFDSTRTSLVVAGGGNEPANFVYFIRNTNPSANYAHSALSKARRYGQKVLYQNPQQWQDLNGNNQDDRIVSSSEMTASALREQILRLEDSRDSDHPNVIYLSGHGHVNEFDINGDPTQNVSADSLGSWIDQAALDVETPLVMVIEACNAGSLVEELSVGRSNRVLIVSGRADETCSFVSGKSFSTEFWYWIQQGQSVSLAFDSAKAWTQDAFPDQNPGLDANGNGEFNEPADYTIASDLFIGGEVTDGATLPVILDSTGHVYSQGDSVELATICNAAFENVWYRVYPYGGTPNPEAAWWGTMNAGLGFHYTGLLTGLTDYAGQNFVVEINGLDDYVRFALPRTLILHVGQTGVSLPPVPESFSFETFPNPFNSSASLRFSLSVRTKVALDIWNILGQKVAMIADEAFEPGVHVIQWAGTNDQGVALPSGMYFVRMRAGDHMQVKKMLLLR
ncbi:MAG: T9SS type A sorting domain-containing protein [Calditrichaeota bacterium]|nr:T9SS type A sorting domain-containing protein [Calditrichota bacterium]